MFSTTPTTKISSIYLVVKSILRTFAHSKNKKMKYDTKSIPPSWVYCFNGQCPLHQECLRYETGLEVSADKKWGNAVFPKAVVDGKCPMFRSTKKVRFATGFVIDNNPRLTLHFTALRHQLGKYLGGGGTYYLYRNGKRWLTPEQQQVVAQIFKDNGYQDEVGFAKYKEDYDFT